MAKAAGKPPKPKPPKDDRPQAERFIETARKLGADETGEAFENAFSKIVPPVRIEKKTEYKAWGKTSAALLTPWDNCTFDNCFKRLRRH